MFVVRTAAVLVLLLVPAAVRPGVADEPPGVRVDLVPKATELRLSDARTVRLAGIRPARSLEEAADAALADLARGHEVRLFGGATDRWGRTVAQVERADGVWLQGALLERGLAVVQPEAGTTPLRLEQMRTAERAARRTGQGVWAKGGQTLPADEPARLAPGFAIVRGRVRELARTRYAIYLNFGEPWWHDFTLKVGTGAVERAFAEAGLPLDDLPGRTVEARGYVVEAGGPLIELFHPAQIEVHR